MSKKIIKESTKKMKTMDGQEQMKDGQEQMKDGHEETSCHLTGETGSSQQAEKNLDEIRDEIFEYIFNESKGHKFEQFKNILQKLLTVYVKKLCEEDALKNYHIVFLWTKSSLSGFHLDQIHKYLKENKEKSEKNKKDILLIINNSGGTIEPAFQISKICNKYKKEKFIVAIPRKAKSAATLIALGANEIHLGDLGELGPIDPQIQDTPALGISDALNMLAEVVARYPESVKLFSDFLIQKMDLQILGWLARIPQSASQYAQRLLSINHKDKIQIEKIANNLVKDYKDHGFVIDSEEAKNIFGKEISEKLIQINTPLIDKIEQLYSDFSSITTWINYIWIKDASKFNLQIDIVGKPKCNIFILRV